MPSGGKNGNLISVGGGDSPAPTLKLVRTNEYYSGTIVETSDFDTGVLAADISSDAVVTAELEFEVDATGDKYALVVIMDNGSIQTNPDSKKLRTAEPITGSGDVAFAVWLSSATGTYHYSIDVDGGGKTLLTVFIDSSRYTLT